MLKSPADGVPTHRGRPIYHMRLRLDSVCNDESPTHPGPWIHDPWPQISLAPNGSDPLVIDPMSYIKKHRKVFSSHSPSSITDPMDPSASSSHHPLIRSPVGHAGTPAVGAIATNPNPQSCLQTPLWKALYEAEVKASIGMAI